MLRVHDVIVQSSTSITKSTHVNASGKDIHEECGETFGHRDGDDIENVRSRLVEILTDQMSACQRPLCKKKGVCDENKKGCRKLSVNWQGFQGIMYLAEGMSPVPV